MPLTILSDADIHSLLLSLNRDDIAQLQHNLSEALHDYSTGTQETTVGCSANQPQRIAVPAANNQTTLFMPASTSTSRGIKIVTLATAPVPSREPSVSDSIGSSVSKLSIDSPRSTSPAPQSPSTTSSKSTINTTSYTPSIASSQSADPSVASSQTTTPRGSLTLLTSSGIPYAFLGAEELTAFRTALASAIILNRRSHVHSIAVFGAGKQAAWHIRLALIIRGSEIHHIDIVNRSFARAKTLMHEFYTSPDWEDLRNANPKLAFSIVSSEYGEYQRLLKEHVRKADVIFMCTPSTSPLFPAEYLTSSEGRKKGRYISAIGSYRRHMIEILTYSAKPLPQTTSTITISMQTKAESSSSIV